MNHAERQRIRAEERERLIAKQQFEAERLAAAPGCGTILKWIFLGSFGLALVIVGLDALF
ncbi:hypothetical protein DVJ83_12330 [Deinococcus wulumuqiensis]|uniref:Uncharacterized protein n=1 Tax=Deinococcus wulumuqiensis TaxID=980427 RepID=A0A345IJA9_9DEIO|nr:hypothetical protein DVJ83_12330 [Deinococcus wulumuqiensis]